jgi:hypothetical protein
LSNTKRLGRYHTSPLNYNNNNQKSASRHLDKLPPFHQEDSHMSLLDWDKPLFGYKCSSFQKMLAKANKTIKNHSKSGKFIPLDKDTGLPHTSMSQQ